MWAVIRARQGLPYEQQGEYGFEKNAQHLATFACMPNPQELPEDAVTLAFERATHPKLTKLINAEELVHRQKALAMIDKLVSAPIELAKFLQVGIVPALNAGTRDADGTVRSLASHVLVVVAKDKHGRERMLQAGSIPVLQDLLADSEQVVRAHACQALSALCIDYQHACTSDVIARGTVQLLVERAGQEDEMVLPHALHALKMCLLHTDGLEKAVRHGAIDAMATLLSSGAWEVRAAACRNLFCLAVPMDGKYGCLDEGAVPGLLPRLVELLSDSSVEVRAEALGALSAITISVPAKHKCIDCGAADAIPELLESETSTDAVRINAVKLLASLAESPTGRAMLLRCVDVLERIEAGGFPMRNAEHDKLMLEQAEIAHKMLVWQA